jgi:hypothetical protein
MWAVFDAQLEKSSGIDHDNLNAARRIAKTSSNEWAKP